MQARSAACPHGVALGSTSDVTWTAPDIELAVLCLLIPKAPHFTRSGSLWSIGTSLASSNGCVPGPTFWDPSHVSARRFQLNARHLPGTLLHANRTR